MDGWEGCEGWEAGAATVVGKAWDGAGAVEVWWVFAARGRLGLGLGVAARLAPGVGVTPGLPSHDTIRQ